MKVWIAMMLWVISGSVWALSDDAHRTGYWWGEGFPTTQEKTASEETFPVPAPLPDDDTLFKMHPEQIRRLEQEHMDYALWKLTPEAVGNYYRLVATMRRKAKSFAGLNSYNAMTNIDFSTNPDAPVSNQGIKIKRKMRKQTIASKLSVNRDDFALVLFTQKTCPICEASRSVNRLFVNRHGWLVKEVDIDEQPEIAARHDIRFTPTTIMIQRHSKNFLPVAFGAESVSSLEENTYRALRLLLNEITPQEFFRREDQEGRALDVRAPQQGAKP